MCELMIPKGVVGDLVSHRWGGSFVFYPEITEWLTAGDYEYINHTKLKLDAIEFWISGPEETLVAFKLKWL
jgi:hypothetical protein